MVGLAVVVVVAAELRGVVATVTIDQAHTSVHAAKRTQQKRAGVEGKRALLLQWVRSMKPMKRQAKRRTRRRAWWWCVPEGDEDKDEERARAVGHVRETAIQTVVAALAVLLRFVISHPQLLFAHSVWFAVVFAPVSVFEVVSVSEGGAHP